MSPTPVRSTARSRRLRRLGRRLLCLGAVAATACGGNANPDAPDVILIMVDTLRADRLGFMGYESARTPALDALARHGVVFTQATAPVPRTTPSVASVMTGLWPHHHGSREVGDPIVAGTRLAERLAGAGYWTVGVSANATAGRKEGLAEGFEEFVGVAALEERYRDRIYDVLRGTAPDGIGWADAVNEVALELVDRAPRDRPLMLWAFYFDPHFLYAPPSPWRESVDAEGCWSLYETGKRNPAIVGEVFNDVDGVASRALADCGALYDAEIAYTDDRIGRLLEEIAARRGDRRRLIVFTADHGENLGEGGLFFEHGDNVHDAGIRVPLVFAAEDPDIDTVAAGRVVERPVGLVDIAPTVTALLDLPDPGGWDGADLSPALAARSLTEPTGEPRATSVDPDRVLFSESAAPTTHEAARFHLETGHVWGTTCLHGERFSLCRAGSEADPVYTLHDRPVDPRMQHDVSSSHPEELGELLRARDRWPVASPRVLTARTTRFKLLRQPLLSGGYRDTLVDLWSDPAESIDVSATHPEQLTRLQRALDAWMREWSPPAPLAPDPELARRLRSLGYIH